MHWHATCYSELNACDTGHQFKPGQPDHACSYDCGGHLCCAARHQQYCTYSIVMQQQVACSRCWSPNAASGQYHSICSSINSEPSIATLLQCYHALVCSQVWAMQDHACPSSLFNNIISMQSKSLPEQSDHSARHRSLNLAQAADGLITCHAGWAGNHQLSW